MKPANFWTDFELDAIKTHYSKHGTKFVDEIIFAHHGWRRGHRNVMQKANKMGIKYYGPNKGAFRAGIIPHNKGRKMAPEVREKCAPTMFKPGSIPPNTKPQGDDISIRKSHTGKPEVYLRLELGKWVMLSRHTYQSFYGPVPDGYIVYHKDEDPLNCDIENLGLMSRADNARRNHNVEKVKEKHAALTDEYVVWYMRRYKGIELDLQETIESGLMEIYRKQIEVKRSINKIRNNGKS